jgi:hypothetical protein
MENRRRAYDFIVVPAGETFIARAVRVQVQVSS